MSNLPSIVSSQKKLNRESKHRAFVLHYIFFGNMSISLTYNIDENTCARYIVIPSISSTSNSSNAFNMTLRFIAINRTAFQTLSLFGTSLFASYRCPHPPPAKPPHPPPDPPSPIYKRQKSKKKCSHTCFSHGKSFGKSVTSLIAPYFF